MSVLETLLMIDLVSIGATLRWLHIWDSITNFDYTTLFDVSLMFKQITNHFTSVLGLPLLFDRVQRI